jgi:fibronectin-binding autotransporter adhesin
MKHFLSSSRIGLSQFAIVLGIGCIALPGFAQNNSWTSPTSGNWQDGSWSLGIIPGTNQNIMLTNAGWKAVQIGASTAQSFPQSLNVNSITISSPTNSFNTLLLNYAGSATPLTVKSLSVGSNSAMTMISSALQLNGPNGSTMMIGGQFNQNDSVVAGNQINVGYIGEGVYNFNSGYLTVSQLWLGGSPSGVFNQNGGTNGFGITELDGGKYVLSNGFFGATIYFDGGVFQQEGGVLNSGLTLFNGNYVLDGGVHQGNTAVPYYNGYTSGAAGMQQSGGTNYGDLNIGSYGFGRYTMSGGVSLAGSVTVGYDGSYNQSGGTQSITGMINVNEQQIAYNTYQGGFFNLDGGLVSASGMVVAGYYTQTGGTNFLAGNVAIQGVESSLTMSGGLLTTDNVTAIPGFEGGIFLNGGTLVVTNTLSVGGNSSFSDWKGFVGGGQLIVSDISLTPQASFSCGGGAIAQSGTLTLANADLFAGSNSMQFGRLCLGNGGNTNSTVHLPAGASVLHFADSSSVTWSNEPMLLVDGWSGSLFGGGQQRIIFGNNAGALTAAQLGKIQFQNPAGLAAGNYPAKILSSGEIVPNSGVAQPASMALAAQPGGMQVTLQGEAGRTYCIEVSTDLVHWVAWTNCTNTNGTTRVTDTANCPARFYRARLVP